ncbi:MAG: class I SAM-dependent methyltransferase [Arenicella sp.]|nr:class I SAM-dependent methyltransferase [Arenicella sp.]
MDYPKNVLFDITTLINVAQPESVLLLGDAPFNFLDDYLEQKSLLNQACVVRHIAANEAASTLKLEQRFDAAVALNFFEHLPKQQGAQILARLRDVLCPQYCICLPLNLSTDNGQWQLTDLFGFGLSRVAEYRQNGTDFGLFKYNISDYKKTPDWLNADNWANPQMWGKYWW